jgi:hypothetical protein
MNPVRVLLAFQPPFPENSTRLHGFWLGPPCEPPVPSGLLRDLVSECLSPAKLPLSRSLPMGDCPVCGAVPLARILTPEGRPVCPAHLADLWTRRSLGHGVQLAEGKCPHCGENASLLWEDAQQPRCVRCLCREVLEEGIVSQWIWVGEKPLALGALEDLRLLVEAWRRVGSCERCGSQTIRIRRVLLDFPRAQGPLYPVWEMRRNDMNPEGESRRVRQLRVYTEGVLRATVECPQCGYLEREFTGLQWAAPATARWPHLASPIVF